MQGLAWGESVFFGGFSELRFSPTLFVYPPFIPVFFLPQQTRQTRQGVIPTARQGGFGRLKVFTNLPIEKSSTLTARLTETQRALPDISCILSFEPAPGTLCKQF